MTIKKYAVIAIYHAGMGGPLPIVPIVPTVHHPSEPSQSEQFCSNISGPSRSRVVHERSRSVMFVYYI